MRQLSIKIVFILTAFIEGCATTPRIRTANKAREDLRDVFILSLLARDYLRSTDGRDFNLDKLIGKDSLGRISNNFERIEQVNRNGHIAIQYKFSNKREYKIEFSDEEGKMIENWRVVEKKLSDDIDGEIQFEYGERFYNFRKIIVKTR